jgi:hypothetical protein
MFWHRAIKSSLGCQIKEPPLTIDTTIPIRFDGPKTMLTLNSAGQSGVGNFSHDGFLELNQGRQEKFYDNEHVKSRNHPQSVSRFVSFEGKYFARSTTEESSDFARKILRKSLAPPLWRVLIRAESGDSTHKQKTKNNQ